MTTRIPLCVVHIGTEKTGTTSIQEFLSLNRDRLRAIGWLYPETFGPDNHTKLPAYALDDARDDDTRRHWLDAERVTLEAFRARIERAFDDEVEEAVADGCERLVVSNEHLHSRLASAAELRRLRTLLDRHCDQYRVVVYLRRQDLLAVSLLSTKLKLGGTALAPVFPRGGDPYFDRYFDYRGLLERYAVAFGAEAITVRIFEEEELAGGSVVEDFRTGIGLPPGFGVEPPRRRNESLQPAAQQFLAAFNRLATEGEPTPLKLRTLVGLLERHFAGRGRLPARRQAERFLRGFAEDNEWVRQTFRSDREALFSDDLSMYPEDPAAGGPEQLVRVAATLLTEQQARITALKAGIRIRDGILRLKAGDAKGGAERFREAIRLAPGHPEAHRGLSACLRSLGRTAEAIGAAKMALALAPDEADHAAWLASLEADRAAAE